jgi:ATP-binding cassette subfamily B protein
VGNLVRATLSEKVGFVFDQEIARISAGLPGLEHYERIEYQDRLELIRQNQGALGTSITTLLNVCANLITAASVLILLATISPMLLLLTLLVIPASVASRLEQRWHAEAETESAQRLRVVRHLRRLSYDRDAGIEVRIFGLQNELERRIRTAWDIAQRPILRAGARADVLNGIQQVVSAVALVAAIAYVLWLAANHQATVGQLVMAIYTCQRIQQVVSAIHGIGKLGRAFRAADRMLWLRDYSATADSRRSGTRPVPDRIESGIRFENVGFRYPGTERWILRHLSFTLPAGSTVAVVGENGAGKSTLVKLLTKMYEPCEGRILVDGVDLANIDAAAWRRRASAAFQDFARPEFSLNRAVSVGDLRKLDDEAAVLDAVERARASDLVRSLPFGLQTELGSSWRDGLELSTGQWHKIAVSRALMRDDPLVVFLDEPTASMDAATEHALFDSYLRSALERSGNGTCTMVISHRFSTVRAADLILVLHDGKVLESGTHTALMNANGLYADLNTLQSDGYA